MNKRIASLLLAVAMIASLGIMAMAADQKLVKPTGAAKTYTDVPATYHFYTEVQDVTRAGLFQGTTDTTFSPYAYMSRGQFVMVLARLEGIAGNGGVAQEGRVTDTVFTDVANTYRFAAAIKWATDNNIVNGYTETTTDGTSVRTFRPRDAISRAQIAAMLNRYMDFKKYSLKEVTNIPAQFTDYEKQVTLADGTISTACPQTFRANLDYGRRYGLIQGYSDGTYRPNIPVGRAQVAAMLDRIVINVTPSGRSGGGGGGGGGYTYNNVAATDNSSVNGTVQLFLLNNDGSWNSAPLTSDSDTAKMVINGSRLGVRVDVTDNAYTLDTARVVDVSGAGRASMTLTMNPAEGVANRFEGTFTVQYDCEVQVTYKTASPNPDETSSDGKYKITLSGSFSNTPDMRLVVSQLTGSDGFGDALKALNDNGGLKNVSASTELNGNFFMNTMFPNAANKVGENPKSVTVNNATVIRRLLDVDSVKTTLRANGVTNPTASSLTMEFTVEDTGSEDTVKWTKAAISGAVRDTVNGTNYNLNKEAVPFDKLMDAVNGKYDDFEGLRNRVARNINNTFGLNLSANDDAVAALITDGAGGFVQMNSRDVTVDNYRFVEISNRDNTVTINLSSNDWYNTNGKHFENLVDATYGMIDAIKGSVTASTIQSAGRIGLEGSTTYSEVAQFLKNVTLTDKMDDVWADLGRTGSGSFSFTWHSDLAGSYQSLFEVFADNPGTGVDLTLTIEKN